MADDWARLEREVAGLVVGELDGRDWTLQSACLSVGQIASRLGSSAEGTSRAISRLVHEGRLRCYSATPRADGSDADRLLALAPTRRLMHELGRILD